jgi:hypothetical protein
MCAPLWGRMFSVFRVAEAKELGISRSTGYERVRTGEIPFLRFRKRIVVAASVIDQMLSPAAGPSSEELGEA